MDSSKKIFMLPQIFQKLYQKKNIFVPYLRLVWVEVLMPHLLDSAAALFDRIYGRNIFILPLIKNTYFTMKPDEN